MTKRERARILSPRRAVLFFFGLGVVLAGLVMIPWDISGLSSHPQPVQSYEQAAQKIAELAAKEPDNMNPDCRTQWLTHGNRAAIAIVLVHGYTSCPKQFRELGQRFYDLGYDVLIPPLPHHGLADRMTDEHAHMTAEELAAYADTTVDIAQGLGDRVVMMGLSAGGVVTAWAAQNRMDLDLAIIISPGFGFKQIPTPWTAAAMNLYMLLPNSFEWWDPVLQANGGPKHAYPRYSMHALVQVLRLGFATQAAAQRVPPGAREIRVVLNANDNAVNNSLTKDVAALWRARNARLATHEFDASLKLGHDLIDPSQQDQRIDVVYPFLIGTLSQFGD